MNAGAHPFFVIGADSNGVVRDVVVYNINEQIIEIIDAIVCLQIIQSLSPKGHMIRFPAAQCSRLQNN